MNLYQKVCGEYGKPKPIIRYGKDTGIYYDDKERAEIVIEEMEE